MGHGLYSSFEARKSAHLRMTETVRNSFRAYDDFLILKLAR